MVYTRVMKKKPPQAVYVDLDMLHLQITGKIRYMRSDSPTARRVTLAELARLNSSGKHFATS